MLELSSQRDLIWSRRRWYQAATNCCGYPFRMADSWLCFWTRSWLGRQFKWWSRLLSRKRLWIVIVDKLFVYKLFEYKFFERNFFLDPFLNVRHGKAPFGPGITFLSKKAVGDSQMDQITFFTIERSLSRLYAVDRWIIDGCRDCFKKSILIVDSSIPNRNYYR